MAKNEIRELSKELGVDVPVSLLDKLTDNEAILLHLQLCTLSNTKVESLVSYLELGQQLGKTVLTDAKLTEEEWDLLGVLCKAADELGVERRKHLP